LEKAMKKIYDRISDKGGKGADEPSVSEGSAGDGRDLPA